MALSGIVYIDYKGDNMHQKLQNLPVWKQHLYSFLLTGICVSTAIAAALSYYVLVSDNAPVILLFFLLAVITISYCTTGYWYGIACCLFTSVWLYCRYMPYNIPVHITLINSILTFFIMSVISAFIRSLSLHLIRLENTIAEHGKQLSESAAEKMRANLLRAISHDIRTPLTVIIGNSSLYLENANQLNNAEKTKLLTNILEESNWLLTMVENLLTITRIEDNLSIVTRDESVEEVIAEALQKLKKRYPDISVNVQMPGDCIFLPMDAILIEQVTINFLSNAIVHSNSTGPIDLIVRDSPHAVSFTVRDYGIGIPMEKLDCLFDGAHSPSAPAADSYKGMGIGLSICKTILTAHHGTIMGRNHKNGAEFIFTLPKS